MNQRKRKSAIVIRRLVGQKIRVGKMKIWKESVVDNRIEVVVGGETLRSKSRYPRVVLQNAQLRNFRYGRSICVVAQFAYNNETNRFTGV